MTPAPPIQANSQKRVGIWIRVSSEEQAEGDSPEHHRMRATHYCEAKSWRVVEVYDLAGVSGRSVADHPECKRMKADIKRGHIQALVFTKLARLTRNVRELMEFSDFFQQSGADLVSLSENVDTSSPAGRLFFNLVGCMAQWEREEITDRIKSSIAIRTKLGKPISGKVPFGYQWKDKKLVVHKENAAVRRLIYELFAEHQRIKTVARILNERGYRSPTGGMWSDTSIRWQLKESSAKGVYKRNYTRNAATNNGQRFKSEGEFVFVPVEPIVTPELWQRCNALLEARYMSRSKPSKKPAHLFSGLVVCGGCGGKMYVSTKSPNYSCRKCSTRISGLDLEQVFLDQLRGYLVHPANIERYLTKQAQALAETEELLASRRKAAATAAAETKKILQLYLENKITTEDFGQMNQPFAEQVEQTKREIPELEAQVDALKIENCSSEQIASEATDLFKRWTKMTLAERRQIAELIVKVVTVGNDHSLNLELYHLPSYKELSKWQSTSTRVHTRDTGSSSRRSSGPGCRSW
jgi:site-specific DNA recombinase